MKRSGPLKQGAWKRSDRKEAAAVAKLRKAPARKAAMKAKKIRPLAAESVWMASVAELGCIVCRMQSRGFVPCAVHHIVEGNRRLGHMFTIGLSDPGHHQNSPDPQQISRHPNKARFTATYGSEYALLKITQDILAGAAR